MMFFIAIPLPPKRRIVLVRPVEPGPASILVSLSAFLLISTHLGGCAKILVLIPCCLVSALLYAACIAAAFSAAAVASSRAVVATTFSTSFMKTKG